MLVEFLGGRCNHCKQTYPVAVLDFHHRDPKQKKFEISGAVNDKGYAELIQEARKCDLLCANCHRMLHFGEEKWQTLTSQLKQYWRMKADYAMSLEMLGD
jgi:hypothetical protein